MIQPNGHLPSSGQKVPIERYNTNEGWRETEPYDKDWFNQLYHSNLIQRQSCQHCRFCKIPRVGEITIGDDWRYYTHHINEPEMLRLGRSLVIINNEKGLFFFQAASKDVGELCPAGYIEGGHITVPPSENPLSELFFKDIRKRKVTETMWDYTTKKSFRIKWHLFLQSPFGNTKRLIIGIAKKIKK